MPTRSAIRHPKFAAQIIELERRYPRLREIVDGAIWEISKDPEGCGVYIPEIDVWQARLDPPPILLFYSIQRRFVYMLTVCPSDS